MNLVTKPRFKIFIYDGGGGGLNYFLVKLGTLACKLSVYLSSVKASKLSKVFTKLELLGNIIVLMQAFFWMGGGGDWGGF